MTPSFWVMTPLFGVLTKHVLRVPDGDCAGAKARFLTPGTNTPSRLRGAWCCSCCPGTASWSACPPCRRCSRGKPQPLVLWVVKRDVSPARLLPKQLKAKGLSPGKACLFFCGGSWEWGVLWVVKAWLSPFLGGQRETKVGTPRVFGGRRAVPCLETSPLSTPGRHFERPIYPLLKMPAFLFWETRSVFHGNYLLV